MKQGQSEIDNRIRIYVLLARNELLNMTYITSKWNVSGSMTILIPKMY